MPALAGSRAHLLNNRLAKLLRASSKVETLFNSGHVSLSFVETTYEALYLRAFTQFEAFIEDTFIGLLSGDFNPPSPRVRPKIPFPNQAMARTFVYRGKSYVNWMPYDKTLELAEIFFASGRPFTNLDNADKKDLNRLLLIRNLLAHKSLHSKKKFHEEVVGSTPLLPREKTPAGYLRSIIIGSNPSRTRFEHHLRTIGTLAVKIYR